MKTHSKTEQYAASSRTNLRLFEVSGLVRDYANDVHVKDVHVQATWRTLMICLSCTLEVNGLNLPAQKTEVFVIEKRYLEVAYFAN